MNYTQEEKIIILGGLFHDIGKFEQRCTNNPEKKKHQQLGAEFVQLGRLVDKFEKILGKEHLASFLNIISEHHNPQAKGLTAIVRAADRLSASERVEKEFENDNGTHIKWGNKHLASVFSKIQLLGNQTIEPRYFKQELLVKQTGKGTGKSNDRFNIIIPEAISKDEIASKEFAYSDKVFTFFTEDVEAVLALYENEEDFSNILNILLLVFEKYLWCIPDFTGSSQTDISLYNHLKDVAGIALALYRAERSGNGNRLLLVIGDIPGIQKYIFNVVNTKPAKILRGRSIYVQVFTRMLVNKFLAALSLPETNVIMMAGGKFYILVDETDEVKQTIEGVNKEIDQYLYENFHLEFGFNSAFYGFSAEALKDHTVTFGEIVEEASFALNKNKNLQFSSLLFGDDAEIYTKKAEYIDPEEDDTDSVKCSVTGMPIMKNALDTVTDDDASSPLKVTRQVKIEYKIGEKVVYDNTVIPVNETGLVLNVANINLFTEYEPVADDVAWIILNPDLDTLIKSLKNRSISLKNTSYLEVANFCSKEKKSILDFGEMSECNIGAEYLTLIKGDIDNLGLVMAYGLKRDGRENKDLSAISRTTTLSTHLKYFFSFFLNGFMESKATDYKNGIEEGTRDRKIYTVFAGGDDLMLVMPQSYSVTFIDELNERFNEFVCHNPEVHISYSVTHFKHSTPIRLVADIAEHNQSTGKRVNKEAQRMLVKKGSTTAFYPEHDKSTTFVFETALKNSTLSALSKKAEEVAGWVTEKEPKLSHGMVRKLLEVAEAIRSYEEKNDPAYLLWHARLSYSIQRLLKDKKGYYRNDEVGQFFEQVLSFNKGQAKELKQMLYPLACTVIYKLRKS